MFFNIANMQFERDECMAIKAEVLKWMISEVEG